MYFHTLPSGTRLPRADALCTALVTHRRWEPRSENYAANHTVPTSKVQWPTGSDQVYWHRWIAKRKRVTGRYTGTTDEIIRWAACKWGLDENLVRAVAVEESHWHQSRLGDVCGSQGANQGEASYGLFQVKNAHCDGSPDMGGYPWTQQSTSLNADFFGARMRACFNGDFYDGGDWLYGGERIGKIIATHGSSYAFWGCVGAWYSGDWYSSAASNYIRDVKGYLAAKMWRHLGS